MNREDVENQEFLTAAAAIYAWMSAADGEISKSEVNGFTEYLKDLDYISDFSKEDFEDYYLELLAAFENNFDDGLNRAQTRIEAFQGRSPANIDLIRVARKSLIADNQLNEAEEKALMEMATLLGVDESNID